MNTSTGFDFSTIPTLITERLTLREPLFSDASDILIFRGDPEVQKYNGPVLQKVAEVETLIEEVRAEYKIRGESPGKTTAPSTIVRFMAYLGTNIQKEIMMIEVSIMIEATWGLTWPRWQKLAAIVEELGFAGLYRADHFPGDQESLELIVSLTYLASQTKRIHFSPLVAPLSFRDPRMLARQAAAIDDLSGGRMILGLGTGWQPREHEVWGYELGDSATRYARFEEGVEVITQLLRSDEPVTFEGQFFQLREALLLPRPKRPQGPPLLIGGNGPRRTLPLVARYADIWNANNLSLDAFRERSEILDELVAQADRSPQEVKRTVMILCWCGRTEAELKQRLRPIHSMLPDLTDLPFDQQMEQMKAAFTPVLERAGAMFAPIFGTPEQVVEQIKAFEAAGADELMLHWLDLDDLDGLQLIASEVLPQLSA